MAISGYAYHPATITVAVGTRVTFSNHDQTAHTATSTMPAFDTGTVKGGQSAAVVLRKPGVYSYYCQFHAFMRGTIVVKCFAQRIENATREATPRWLPVNGVATST